MSETAGAMVAAVAARGWPLQGALVGGVLRWLATKAKKGSRLRTILTVAGYALVGGCLTIGLAVGRQSQ